MTPQNDRFPKGWQMGGVLILINLYVDNHFHFLLIFNSYSLGQMIWLVLWK